MSDVTTITQQLIAYMVAGREFQWEEIEPLCVNALFSQDEQVKEMYGERAIAMYLPNVIAILFEGGNQWLQVQHVFQLVR